MKTPDITAEQLRAILTYDPTTGVFEWLVSPIGRMKPGDKAGGPNAKGYWFIGINGVRYYAHRLAWLYMTGAFPPHQIDHIDFNKSNNAWNNLRPATRTQNQHYKPKMKNNKSGFKGVWKTYGGRYRADIRENQRSKYIGTYDTPEEAYEAYCREGRRIFGEFWHAG